VNIKWGKETFKDVEVNTAEDALTFKGQIYALSSVPTESQKILIKGKQVKDDSNLATLGLKDGITIMLMGTAEGREFKGPAEKVVF
jgi:ubiquitin carboxyl-terminal hydrolase 14